jgi:hypothetical protein
MIALYIYCQSTGHCCTNTYSTRKKIHLLCSCDFSDLEIDLVFAEYEGTGGGCNGAIKAGEDDEEEAISEAAAGHEPASSLQPPPTKEEFTK